MKALFTILAIIYTLSPYDILPDVVVGWGWLDDLAVLYLLWRFFYSARRKGAGALGQFLGGGELTAAGGQAHREAGQRLGVVPVLLDQPGQADLGLLVLVVFQLPIGLAQRTIGGGRIVGADLKQFARGAGLDAAMCKLCAHDAIPFRHPGSSGFPLLFLVVPRPRQQRSQISPHSGVVGPEPDRCP